MNKETQMIELQKLFDENMEILKSKGADYATNDILSNFKRLSGTAKALNLDISTPVGYSLFMVLLKIDRINNLLTGDKTPNNESVADSFKDGINYFQLAYLNYIDKSENTK